MFMVVAFTRKKDSSRALAIRNNSEVTWFDIRSGNIGVRPAIWVENGVFTIDTEDNENGVVSERLS